MADTEETTTVDAAKVPAKRKRPFARGFKLVGILLVFCLIGLAGLSLSGQSVFAPRWLTNRVEQQVNAGLGSGRISIGRMALRVDEQGVPRILFGNVGVFDARGSEIARLNSVGAGFSNSGLVRGELRPERIRLNGAEVTLRRDRNGEFSVSFGGGATVTQSFPEMLDNLDALFATAPMRSVQNLEATALTVTIEDGRSGRLWQVTDGEIQVTPGEEGLDLSIAFDVFNGTEDLAETIVGIQTDATSSSATIGTSFRNATAADIAAQSAVLSFLGVLKAPISGAVRARFDAVGALEGLAGTLEIGQGALKPTPDIPPVSFDEAKTYFEFDPATNKLEFSQVSVQSDTASVVASGHAYLREFQDGFPTVLLGQFELEDIHADLEEAFGTQIDFTEGATDFRLRLDPFAMDIGQFVLSGESEIIHAEGRIEALDTGWVVGGDFGVDEINKQRLLQLWPEVMVPNTRLWIEKHLLNGTLSDIRVSVRAAPERATRRVVSWNFSDTTVQYMNSQPPISGATGYATMDGNAFTVVVESGTITPPIGGPIDMAGSVIQIPDVSERPAELRLNLHGVSSATSALSLLDEKPFRVLKRASFGADVAKGNISFEADVSFRLKSKVVMEDVDYSVVAVLDQIETEKLIPGRKLTGERLQLTANKTAVEITGPVRLGRVGADITWRQVQGPETRGQSTVSGTVELSQAFVDEFQIGLPNGSVSGAGIGQFTLDLAAGLAPKFLLNSDLNRVGIAISAIGWAKAKNATGKLHVKGQLGDDTKITELEIAASGLTASGGSVVFGENNIMQSVNFGRVRVGGWLDSPVVFRGRGRGVSPSVHLAGGTLDIRKTSLSGGQKSNARGGGGPIELEQLNIVISEGISLTSATGSLKSSDGLSGTFRARMNGQTALQVRLVPEANGTAARVQSDRAGQVLRDAGVLEYARGGTLDLTLRPQKQNGYYLGKMTVLSTRVKNAPGLTDLLSAVSIVGLLDQLDGGGISFDKIDADFQITPTVINLTKSSAVGPSLGVAMTGTYDLQRSQMDMEGVISPLYFLNGIGQIFTREGEGLFGFNFDITGSSSAPDVSVNPLSILTPGVFRKIFRSSAPKKN